MSSPSTFISIYVSNISNDLFKSKLNIKEAKQKLKKWLDPRSNHYYNYRYRFFEKAERGRDQLLSQTYICFINTLYWEVRLKLRSKKYTQKQIILE